MACSWSPSVSLCNFRNLHVQPPLPQQQRNCHLVLHCQSHLLLLQVWPKWQHLQPACDHIICKHISSLFTGVVPSLRRCTPTHSSDLVVQKKKVEQIRAWLLAEQGPSLLFLSGKLKQLQPVQSVSFSHIHSTTCRDRDMAIV